MQEFSLRATAIQSQPLEHLITPPTHYLDQNFLLNTPKPMKYFFLTTLFLFFLVNTHQQVLTSTEDTYIDQTQPNTNIGYYPNALLFGREHLERRILLSFDLSDLKSERIKSVTLIIWSANTLPTTGEFLIHRILPANHWTENDVSWEHAISPIISWAGSMGCSTQNIDYSPEIMGIFSPSGQPPNTPITIELSVQEFEAMRKYNAGLIIFSTSENPAAFRTSEYSVIEERPKLIINGN